MTQQNSAVISDDRMVVELSDLDRKILEVVQANFKKEVMQEEKEKQRPYSLRIIADMIKKQYPDKTKPSVTAIKNHLSDLEGKGVIKHYTAIVNCCKVGYTEMLVVNLRVNTKATIEQISEQLSQLESINAIYQISGIYPILLLAKCVSKDEQIELLEKIKSIKGVDEVITQLVMNKIKEDFRIKIPETQIIPKENRVLNA